MNTLTGVEPQALDDTSPSNRADALGPETYLHCNGLACAEEEVRTLRAVVKSQTSMIEQLGVAQALVNYALDGITLTSLDGRVIYANASFKAMSGFGESAVGRTLEEFYDPENYARLQAEVVPVLFNTGAWSGILRIKRPNGSEWLGQTSAFLIRDAAGAPTGMAGFFRDVTTSTAERLQLKLQTELVKTQQRALRALGTPLLPIADGVVAMPLVGDIDDARAAEIQRALIDGIASHHARVAILDITGVKLMDAEIADALVSAAKAARLLGVEMLMTGISPAVAKTLVEIGAELSGIVTRGTLQSGIAYALSRGRR
ncbi:STAS domain-containing protein [Polyangium sp. 15x6]|uniref:STAS domain-containing protein n=1 Tax=Polyangium sp. 15x6 TaxID=3042687 RepID=UPI002499C73A|nr:STAS domain-containing protein [Polyangium sp. 15x6]MDI3284631.1 PAS domain S-box protein [Polyangium sp. 15x6]